MAKAEVAKVRWVMPKWFRIYILPGLVFQSVVIGGAYASGREIMEFFGQYGTAGYAGILITTLVWALVCALGYEFIRLRKTYDYRSLTKAYLGRAWPLFDINNIIMWLLVVAVIFAAGGAILKEAFGIPFYLTAAFMALIIILLCFYGRAAIEGYMTIWSFLLYAMYLFIFIAGFLVAAPHIIDKIAKPVVEPGWALAGFKYGMYNLAAIPAVLFVLDVFESRRQAILSGIITSLIGIIPGFLFFTISLGFYPEIVPKEVPMYFVVEKIGIPALIVFYLIVLIATLIETGVGGIHAINERVRSQLLDWRGIALQRWHRAVLTVVITILSVAIAKFGLIPLVAKGYGTMAWVYFILLAIPLVVMGIYEMVRRK